MVLTEKQSIYKTTITVIFNLYMQLLSKSLDVAHFSNKIIVIGVF